MKKAKKQRLLAFSTLLLTGALALGVAAMPATAEAAETYAGTLTLTDNGGAMAGGVLSSYHSAYNKTWVDVADDEDLIIEYELIGSPLTYANFGLVKGLQSTTDYTKNIDAYYESVMTLDSTNDQLHLGYLSSFVADSHIEQSSRSAAAKSYMKSNKGAYKVMSNSASIGGVYNIAFEMSSAQNWCYTFIASYYDGNLGANYCNYPHKGFATEGFAYRHIYAADGHYELWAKNATGFDTTVRPFADWTKILTTDATFGGERNTAAGFTVPEEAKNEKIFVNRSGYIGFVSNPKTEKTQIEIDNFKVSVTDGTNTTVKINETYDCTKDSVYNTDNWGYTKTGVTTLNCDIPTGEEKVVTKYTDGTATITEWQSGGILNHLGGIYHKTPITVADNENLIVEYDYIKDSGAYYFGIVKGMTEVDGKVKRNAGSDIESVLAMTNNHTTLGTFVGALRNTYGATYSSDEALNAYLTTQIKNQYNVDEYPGSHYYTNCYGVNFKTTGVTNTPLSFRTVGYTYKHVFLAAGGYECYAKAIGAADSEYSLILKTANTWAEDSYHGTKGCTSTEKIFANRSGYVGFAINGDDASLLSTEIDNFKVTVSGTTKTTVINETYDRDTIKDKATANWGYIAGGATTINYEDIAPATADGAGIRVEVGNMTRSGIRFQTNVDKALVAFLEASKEAGEISTIEYGTLITAKDLLGENEFTAEALTAASVAYKNLTASGFNADCATDTTYGYYASLVGIQAENYYRSWIARGYVKTTDSTGATTYYYSDFDVASAGTSVYEAAVAIYENTEYYNTLSTDAQAVVKSYIDGVVVVTLDEVNGTATYAGEVAGYTAPYTLSVDTTTGVLTVTSTAYIRTLVVNGVQVKAEVADGAKTATYTFRQSA